MQLFRNGFTFDCAACQVSGSIKQSIPDLLRIYGNQSTHSEYLRSGLSRKRWTMFSIPRSVCVRARGGVEPGVDVPPHSYSLMKSLLEMDG